ncbi:putative drug exporter of the RND superfamily [Agromyces sp. CF514]|uniref:MMPL family transporter n=1 Tax=Agromyces sp. CF514 TaxID=1881031 RepID=UPI0008EB02AC|nr:MMPL family transporter [Agromyces sp. CF514]SFR71545.1 putative drug exporter of the RND superfamily [Agromyces sp. CF514]
MLVLWLGVLAVCFTGAALIGQGTDNTYSIPGTESQDALDALARTFPQVSGATAQLIAVAPDGGDVTDAAFEQAVEAAIADIEAIPQVEGASSPYATPGSANLAPDGSAALVPIQLSVSTTSVTPETADALQAAGDDLEQALPDGSQVAVGGQLFAQTSTGISITELLGILVAYLVLLVAFASFTAAGIPLVTALLGVGVSLAIVLTGTGFLTITSTTPLLALMLGLAVGIDYGLFIVSRHRDQVQQGLDVEESAARAVATSGSAVVFAAMTVIIALLGLAVAGIPFLTTMGVAAALAVATAVAVSLTLTPALLGFAGWHVVAKRYRPGADPATDATQVTDASVATDAGGRPDSDEGASSDESARSDEGADPDEGADHDRASDGSDASAGSESDPATEASDARPETAEPALDRAPAASAPRGFFGGWVRGVTRWPIVTVVLVVGLLALATVPAAHLRLALPDAGSLDEGEPGRVTYDLIAEHFGPGFNGPLIVTGLIIESTDPVGLMDDLGATLAAVPGVASVPLTTPNETGDTGIVQVIPEGSPDSEQTKELVSTLRAMHDDLEAEFGVDLSVTGYTAAGIDISDRLAGALAPFGLLVVGLSLVLLAMVFRSIVVPVTAALGYVLSIGAAFGLTSLVFVDGVGADLLGVADVGQVISFMPIILMGVLFGLAMDYEVFLVSRMREDYVHQDAAGRDATGAVHRGFVASARVVTAAAIIMFSVFVAFVPGGDASIQPIAFGLAVGVAIDAFLVRMTLIPAVLVLFGHHAWWIPAWLDRALPGFDIEGEGLTEEFALADWPEPGDRYVLAAEGVRVAGHDDDPGDEVEQVEIGDEESVGRSAGRAGAVGAADAGGTDAAGRPRGFTARLEAGDALVVFGGTVGDRRELLLALGARRGIAAGLLKVCGLVLPSRAATVRTRTAFAGLAGSRGAELVVRTALWNTRDLVLVDGLDEVGDPDVRRRIAALLAEAHGHAERHGERPLSIVVSAREPGGASDVLPAACAVRAASVTGSSAEAVTVGVAGAAAAAGSDAG